MSPSTESSGRAEPPADGAGVLSNLPRTRPQRTTARRTAARAGREGGAATASRNGAGTRTATKAAGSTAEAPAKAKPQAGTKAKKAKTSPKRPPKRAALPREEVPRQGFECIEERATGAVPPPGGPEFVGTAAEIVGELAKAGIAGGERLLRDVFSRLGL